MHSPQASSRYEIIRWVEQVVLGPEFGGGGQVVSRWVASPRLSVFGATPGQRDVVADSVTEINGSLAGTPIGGVGLLGPGDPAADILVHFAPLSELPRLGREHGFRYEHGNWGFFWTFWTDNRIDRAVVLLASDRLDGPELRHFALEEIVQSLGLSNDSPRFADSIFYSGRSRTQGLSTLDRKLIGFFHTHLEPGATQRELRSAFDEHWPDD